jgi:hypothetical protein
MHTGYDSDEGTFQVRDLTIELHHDSDCQSPRGRDYDEGLLSTFIVTSGAQRHMTSEETLDDEDYTIECAACGGRDEECPSCEGTNEVEVPVEEWLRLVRGARAVVPLGLLVHSGETLYVGKGPHWCDAGGWDSGHIGYAFDTPEARKRIGVEDWDEDRLRARITTEIETYDEYMKGECYGYVITDADGEEVGDCWGYVGEKWCREAATDEAECIIKGRASGATPEDVPFEAVFTGANPLLREHGAEQGEVMVAVAA